MSGDLAMASKFNYTSGRSIANLTSLLTNQIHLRQPFVIAWWSAAFPGFGHVMLCKYFTGFVLMGWELFINVNSNLNTAIILSMIGRWDEAKQVLDMRWFMFYMAIYVFAIWDSYRRTCELNQQFLLAYRTRKPIKAFINDGIELNYLDKRSPGYAVLWTMLLPGLAHLYTSRFPSALILMFIWLLVSYQSNLLIAFHYLTQGSFEASIQAIDPQWFLFIPSMYVFTIYDSYSTTVEYNKLYKREQSNMLKSLFQSKGFRMPS
jgi:hypothetical protein